MVCILLVSSEQQLIKNETLCSSDCWFPIQASFYRSYTMGLGIWGLGIFSLTLSRYSFKNAESDTVHCYILWYVLLNILQLVLGWISVIVQSFRTFRILICPALLSGGSCDQFLSLYGKSVVTILWGTFSTPHLWCPLNCECKGRGIYWCPVNKRGDVFLKSFC